MEKAVMCAVLVFVTASEVSAQPNAGNLNCPPKWTAGQTVTLKFTIDRLLFPSRCTSTDNRPYFEMSTTEAWRPHGVECQTADITNATACTSFPADSLGCGCISKNASHYVVQYKFVAQTTHDGWWVATVLCDDPFAVQQICFTTTQCDNITVQAPTVDNTSTTPSSSSTLVIILGVAGGVCVVMAAVGFYLFRKRRPGQNDAPPANAPRDSAPPAYAPPAYAPQDNAPSAYAPPDNAAPAYTLPDNGAPDNGPQGADTAGASTGQTVPTTPADELDESSVVGSEAGEVSEDAEDTASEVSEV